MLLLLGCYYSAATAPHGGLGRGATAWGHLLPLRLVDPVEKVDEDLVDELALGDLEAHEVLQLREADDDRSGGGEARDDRVREEGDEEAEAQEAWLGRARVRVSTG